MTKSETIVYHSLTRYHPEIHRTHSIRHVKTSVLMHWTEKNYGMNCLMCSSWVKVCGRAKQK